MILLGVCGIIYSEKSWEERCETSVMQGKKHNNKGLILRFIPYFKKYKWVLFFDLFCAALTTVCELVLPMLVRYVTNAGINDLASLTVELVLKIGALYLFLRIVDAAANFFMASIGHIMGTKIETDMRTAMFDHLQKLSFQYFDNTKVGQIMTRITTDLFDVTEFAHHCPEEFFIAGIKIIGSFVILCGVGSILLYLPFSTKEPVDFLDAAFSAVSSVCVTGLSILDVERDFTPWGRFFLALLMQLGGLGMMSLSALVMHVLGRRMSLRHERLAVSAAGSSGMGEDWWTASLCPLPPSVMWAWPLIAVTSWSLPTSRPSSTPWP